MRNGVKLCEKPDCQNKSLAARFFGGRFFLFAALSMSAYGT
jgi:hypothetical protein